METTEKGVNRIKKYRTQLQEIEGLNQEKESLKNELFGVLRDYENTNRNFQGMKQDYEILKKQNDKIIAVSNELKQEVTEVKQQRDMFQNRCNVLETDKNNRSGLLKKPAHIIAVLIVFLIANVWHNAAGYGQAGGNFYFGLFVVLSIDLAVLTFVRNAMKKQAGLYALGTFVITFLSFNPELFAGQYIVVSAIFAAEFSYGIYSFSELFENKN